ncbi:MAG: hypothetical protein ABSG43_26190 [Solirubrobacteraceae bacterium]
MALEADTIKLREAARDRLGADVFDSYLSELEVIETSAKQVGLRVGATLAREASRRCGPVLAGVCGELFGSQPVLLAGEGESFELGGSGASGDPAGEPAKPAKPAKSGKRSKRGAVGLAPGRVRQRIGKQGQPGVHDRLRAQATFRVPFALLASLPAVAEQTPGRHSRERPLEYRGRFGHACSSVTLTSFHHRLLLGLLRIAQAGCLTEQGVSCSVNSLLFAAFGVCSREQPGYAPRVLLALMDLVCCEASMTACYDGKQGKPYIAELRALVAPIIGQVRVRCEDGQLRPLPEVMEWDDERNWWRRTVGLARGGGHSVIVQLGNWVLEDLADVARCELVDTAVLHKVNPRRLFSYERFVTAEPFDERKHGPLPSDVKAPPRNTEYRRLDLNGTSVRDFGRHGQDLDRMINDIVEDFVGARDERGKFVHGLRDIDRQIFDVQVRYGARGAQLWVLGSRTVRGVHTGLPRRLKARQRRTTSHRLAAGAPARRQARREQAAHAGQPSLDVGRQPSVAGGSLARRGVPLIVALARRRESSETDDGDG